MGQCKDCARYEARTHWCARLNRKKAEDSGCREFEPTEQARLGPAPVDVAPLDYLVDWMRRRAVVAVKIGDTAITLGTLEEPSPVPMRPPPATDIDPIEEQKRRQARARAERAETFYGSAESSVERE